jgi:hypothetical protein
MIYIIYAKFGFNPRQFIFSQICLRPPPGQSPAGLDNVQLGVSAPVLLFGTNSFHLLHSIASLRVHMQSCVDVSQESGKSEGVT